jgi:ASCH domain
MRALSIRQPWAWLILHGGKDIENRDWPTKMRGRVLVHAAKGMTRDEWGSAWEFAKGSGANPKAHAAGLTFPTIERGGIVGSVEIVDCVEASASRWFVGRYGFVLRDPRPLPFLPWKGQLGFFEVPADAMSSNYE